MPVLLYSFLFLSAALSGPVLALVYAQPAAGAISLVIGPPWKSSAEIVALSNGYLVGPYTTRLGVLATSDDPNFFDDLKTSGAWFILDGDRLAQLCGVTR